MARAICSGNCSNPVMAWSYCEACANQMLTALKAENEKLREALTAILGWREQQHDSTTESVVRLMEDIARAALEQTIRALKTT